MASETELPPCQSSFLVGRRADPCLVVRGSRNLCILVLPGFVECIPLGSPLRQRALLQIGLHPEMRLAAFQPERILPVDGVLAVEIFVQSTKQSNRVRANEPSSRGIVVSVAVVVKTG